MWGVLVRKALPIQDIAPVQLHDYYLYAVATHQYILGAGSLPVSGQLPRADINRTPPQKPHVSLVQLGTMFPVPTEICGNRGKLGWKIRGF